MNVFLVIETGVLCLKERERKGRQQKNWKKAAAKSKSIKSTALTRNQKKEHKILAAIIWVREIIQENIWVLRISQ